MSGFVLCVGRGFIVQIQLWVIVGEWLVLVNCTVSRLEEKDVESGKEYSKLHERYTDVSTL